MVTGVGEEQPATRREQPRPIGQDGGAAGQVVHRVEAEDGAEGGVVERQPSARIGLREVRPAREAGLGGDARGVRDARLFEVDARDAASGQLREMQRRPAGAARDVEQVNAAAERELVCEPLELGQREPVVLVEVVAELRAAQLRVDLIRELAVMRPVVAGGSGRLGHLSAHLREVVARARGEQRLERCRHVGRSALDPGPRRLGVGDRSPRAPCPPRASPRPRARDARARSDGASRRALRATATSRPARGRRRPRRRPRRSRPPERRRSPSRPGRRRGSPRWPCGRIRPASCAVRSRPPGHSPGRARRAART